MDVYSYLSGYTDGEGCFCVSINKSRRHKFGWEIRPSFSVSQNRDRAEVLKLLQKHFGCGSIRPDRSDMTLKFEIRSLDDLVGKIIPHFEAFPLISSKHKDFQKFAEICKMMQDKEHLTKEGIQRILKLAGEVNVSGKKKFLREHIKI